MFRLITRKAKGALLVLTAAIAAVVSCSPELTDMGEFSLYYPGITDIGPSTNMDLTPTWHGGTPENFEISHVVLDGETVTPECFSVDSETGLFQIRNSAGLAVGKYHIGIACTVNGKRFEFADAIVVNMMRPIPEGIVTEPSEITVLLSQVTNVGSDEELPTSRIITDGEHISIKSYSICGVRRDGVAIEDWAELFSVDRTGKFSILKNGSFKSGVYSIDFKLTTLIVGSDSEEGIFTDALTVDVASPPISLEYKPASSKVEVKYEFVSKVPEYIGSRAGLVFSVKSTMPETDQVGIDPATGQITLAAGNTLAIGDEIVVSVSATNEYGSRDFDQVFKIAVVEHIAPISMLEYKDTTVWEGTKVQLAPVKADGDEVSYSFVDLPEELSELSIDELTGVISVAKKNRIPLGKHTIKVRAENSKGSMTWDINWETIENPYAFTYVRWGNNLDLAPIENYASQYRVSTTDPMDIPAPQTDIKEGIEAVYKISGGSNTKCVTIDAATGQMTTDPSVFAKMADRRAHFVFVTVTTGAGTSGETTVKVPFFLDFNVQRADDGYSIEYTPFAILCNPKNGVTSPAPVVKKNGVALTAEEMKASITMDFRRSFNYWNLNGPASHKNGAPATGTFLGNIWAAYYSTINVGINTGSRDPMSSWGRPNFVSSCPGYIRQGDSALYIAPERFLDDDGYANGIFTGQITFADNGKDPAAAADPYRLFPLFVWFDTEF